MSFRDYILAPWESGDGKLGIRPILATISMVGLVIYVERNAHPDPAVMYVYVALMSILLGLSTTQNIAEKAINSKINPPLS